MPEPEGGKLIFTTVNKRQPEQGTITTKSGTLVDVKLPLKEEDRGICQGMCIRWLRKSMQNLGTELVEVKLSRNNYQKAAMVQGVYESLRGRVDRMEQERATCQYYGLNIIGKVANNESFEDAWRDFWYPLPQSERTASQGYYCLAGTYLHAVAFRFGGGGRNYFFDPNYGLYEYTTLEAMIGSIKKHCNREYDGHYGFTIARVVLAKNGPKATPHANVTPALMQAPKKTDDTHSIMM